LALSKQKKQELVAQYGEWLERSQGLILTEYLGLTVKEMDALRVKVREAGGEFHIVKNTLVKLAFNDADMAYQDETLEGTTAIGFAFEDAPALAKAITDFAKESDFLKVKAGFLDKNSMSVAEVSALANLPPLPVMRATLLSTLLAPASQLVRTLSEPGRQVAAVLNAYAQQDTAPEAA